MPMTRSAFNKKELTSGKLQRGPYLCDGRPEERATTAKTVGDEDQEDATRSDLDNTVNARCEKARGIARYAKVLENLRCVVVDRIRACSSQ